MEILCSLLAYLASMIAAVAWTFRVHLREGPALSRMLFGSRAELAEPANRLVVTGMEALALGFGSLLAGNPTSIRDWADAVELYGDKLGFFLWFLALMHFVRFKNLKEILERGLMKSAMSISRSGTHFPS